MKKKTIYVFLCNHFDLAWRRKFESGIVDKGLNYIPYAAIQEYYIKDNMALCEHYPEYRFNIESVAVVRKFLERCPEFADRLKELVDQGRCYIPMSGDNLIDSNLCSGETLLRNFVYGTIWTEQEFGYTPRLAVRNDTFGNCSQLPQILRGCGVKWMTGAAYTFPQGEYFRGLNGSTVYLGNIPQAGAGGTWLKYPPCSGCGGTGTLSDGTVCEVCGGRGVDHEGCTPAPIGFNESVFEQADNAIITLYSEERLPDQRLLEWAEKMKEKYEVRFATLEDTYDLVEDKLNAVDQDDIAVDPRPELNPNNTGCYVTRIKTKQMLREREYSMLRLETLALMLDRVDAGLAGRLRKLWESVFYGANHDIVTAEHVDGAYEELMGYYEAFDRDYTALLDALTTPSGEVFSLVNTSCRPISDIAWIDCDEGASFVDEEGRPLAIVERRDGKSGLLVSNVAPYSCCKIRQLEGETVPKKETKAAQAGSQIEAVGILQGSSAETVHRDMGEQFTLENERYRLTADSAGILEIYDKCLSRPVAQAGTYRPGQYLLEHDEGSPWATLSPDRREIAMETSLVDIERTGEYERVIYRTRPGDTATYSICGCSVLHSVTLYRSLNRVDFAADVTWDDYNHRLRIAFPVCGKADEQYWYGVPYGAMRRENYESTYHWAGANGDWPVAGWGGMDTDQCSVAVLEKGTPSYHMRRTEGGECLFVSLLRSPCIPTYLHEPCSYSMTAWDGMRDAGNHHFELAFVSYDRPLQQTDVCATAEDYNRGFAVVKADVEPAAMPNIQTDTLTVTAMKPSEDGRGTIIRLADLNGLGGTALVKGDFQKVSVVNMMEKTTSPLPITSDGITVAIRPFEIATVCLE